MDRGHAERLFPLIDACMAEAGLAPNTLDLIAVCTGPGNFTGARIGVAAARGLALSASAISVGVDRFEALAEGHDGDVAVVLAGRGGAVHLARFRDGDLIDEAQTVQAEDADVSGAALIGDGAGLGAGPGATILSDNADAPLAAIAAIAARKAAAGAPRPAPRYLKPVNAALPREAPPPIIG